MKMIMGWATYRRTALFCILAPIVVGCQLRSTLPNKILTESTVLVDSQTGATGLIEFGDSADDIRKKLGDPIYAVQHDGSLYAFDKVYGVVSWGGSQRKVWGLTFNFSTIEKEANVKVTLKLKTENGVINLSKDSTLEQVEKALGCRNQYPGRTSGVDATASAVTSGTASKTAYLLAPLRKDRPCRVVLLPDGPGRFSQLYLRTSNTYLDFKDRKPFRVSLNHIE